MLTAAILMFNRKGDEPAPVVEPAATATALAKDGEPKALVGSDRPEIRHAEAWEKSAEALGEIDKHLNRAKLIFEDVDAATVETGGAQRPMLGGGGGAPPGADSLSADGAPPEGEFPGEGEAAPPPPPPPPPDQSEAIAIWSRWRSDWERDLEVITSMLPKPGHVDGKLMPGYSAVAELIAGCRRLPEGNPPSRAARDSWLRGLQNQSVAVRATLEKSR